MRARQPAVAGAFYPARADELADAVEGSFLHRLGPGALPQRGGTTARGVRAVVCPHAGYAYSGPVAAHSYRDLSGLSDPLLVAVVGPNHYGAGSAGVATFGSGEWVTPLGRVKVDEEASRRIEETTGIAVPDPEAHLREHSIEVQLPFLQWMFGTSVRLLPVCMAFQDRETASALGKGLAVVVSEAAEKGSAVLVASSDLTHYEPAARAVEKDRGLLSHVVSMDVGSFYDTLEREQVTACGYGAVAAVIEAGRALGFERGRLNAYHTSGDVTGDNESVVGYPSVTFLPKIRPEAGASL